ncbi:MAG: gliding motility-associated C-terminal domain-containing protein [Bacteroidota bacterium]
MLNWRKLTLLGTVLLCPLFIFSQVRLEITVLSGTASSDCRDFVGPPEHVWSVNIDNQGWVNYDAEGRCDRFTPTPHLQYVAPMTFDCPSDAFASIPICFRAFENNPGATNPCDNINPNDCQAEICQDIPLPPGGESRDVTIRFVNEADVDGEVVLRIAMVGSYPGGLNDLPCTAVDLGVLTSGSSVGDASLSQFNNYCGTRSEDEPDPLFLNAGWGNNVGVWYTFQTSDNPGDRIIINGTSDPENLGDPIFLQIGLYETSDNTCTGEYIYLGGSGRSSQDNDLSENINFSCDQPLKPNTTYFIIVDGVVDTEEELFGLYGLEVVAINNEPTVIEQTLCAGESIEVLGETYSVSGTYRDSIQLGFDCDSVVITNLVVLDPLVANADQTAAATGENAADGQVNISVSGGTGNYTVTWSDGVNGRSRNDLLGGTTYDVTITDDNGCETTLSIEVEFINAIVASVSSDTLNCFGDTNGKLALTLNNGVPPYEYSWRSTTDEQLQGNGTVRADGGSAIITDLPAGEYVFTINDGTSPTIDITATIVQPDELIAQAVNLGAASCFGFCDAQFTIEVTGGNTPYDYGIPDDNFDAEFNIVQNLCAGTFTTIINDAKGCTTSLQTTLEEPAEFIVDPTMVKNVSCFEGSDGAISVNTNGNPIAYVWSNGASSESIEDLIAGTYTVTVTNQDGCEAEISQTITQPSEPLQVEIQIEQAISCFDTNDGALNTVISGTDTTVSYTWSNAANTASIGSLAPGTYDLLIEDANGCTASDQINLVAPEALSVSFAVENIGCLDLDNAGAILIEETQGGVSPYSYSIDGILFANRERISNLFEGSYDLIVRDANGCERSEAVTIEGPPEISVTLGEDLIVNLGNSTQLTAFTNAANPIFEWMSTDSLPCTDCESITVVPTQKTDYIVSVTDEMTQCTATDRLTVLVDRSRRVYIPNAFSPNNDSANNRFTVYGDQAVKMIKSFQIFNRKGQLVFERFNFLPNDEGNGWDGLFGTEVLNADVFVYYAEVEFVDNAVEIYSGDVALLR